MISVPRQRVWWLSLGALLVPILAMTPYAWLESGTTRYVSSIPEKLVFTTAIGIGLLFILRMPLKRGHKIALGALYVPVMLLLLTAYAVLFVCTASGDCM